MVLKTKYSVGDKLFFLNEKGKAVSDAVTSVHVFAYKDDKTSISYSFKSISTSKDEDEIFPTEGDLKAHVFDDLIEFV